MIHEPSGPPVRVHSSARAHLLTLHVPAPVRRALTERLVALPGHPYDPAAFPVLARLATNVLADVLPPRILFALRAARHRDDGHLEITGTPADPDPIPTPVPGTDLGAVKPTFVPELFSMGVAGLLGQEVYNFRQEGWGTGALIFNIVPVERLRALKGAGGVTDDFRFHMENAWHPQSPDTLLLKGVRQDHDAVATTYVIGNAALLARLSPADRALLREPVFEVLPPEIHRRMEVEKGILFNAARPWVGPILVDDDHTLLLNLNGTRPVPGPREDAVREVLARVEEVAVEGSASTKLTEDNLLVIFNRRSVHTRGGYTPRFDGMDRWFQRYYLLEPGRLWRRIPVRADDLPDVPPAERSGLLAHLRASGVLGADSTLGSAFDPRAPACGVALPRALEPLRVSITKALLDKGPAYPHRLV